MDEIRHESFTITRTYGKCRAHVWSAWADRETKYRWLAGDGGTAAVGDFELDFRVGGGERHAFTSPMGRHENRTTYFEIADEERIVYAYSMSLEGRVHSVSVATVRFFDEVGGTRMEYHEQLTLIGASDDAEGRRHGWTLLLDRIESVLDPELA
jgi:uncharacterized protein YndB with AHSA1/START domain